MRAPHLPYFFLKALSSACFLLLCTLSFAQKTLIIVDESSLPLAGVECFNVDYSFTQVSNLQGEIIIPEVFINDEVTLKFLGYNSVQILPSQIEDSIKTIQLSQAENILEEVVLIGRTDIRERDFLQSVQAIDQKAIQSTNAQSTADALGQHADVYVQKSQMGGGSPVIRGFEANKVLLVVDGVRMNNAIYRNGHLQNAITIDNAILDQMEVIYGPSSLMYGSDALGGVVHFRTKTPRLNLSSYQNSNFEGNSFLRYSSANQEKTGHVDWNLGFRKWAFLSSVTYSHYEDLRMGSRRTSAFQDYGKLMQFPGRETGEDVMIDNPNENIQKGTAFSRFDLLQKIRYQINQDMNLNANIQYSSSSNIPRYDQLRLRKENDEALFSEWNYGPQKRLLSSLQYKWNADLLWADELIVIASFQDIQETRITRIFQSDFRENQIEDVQVFGLTADAMKKWENTRKQQLYYGIDLNKNVVNSGAFRENINSSTTDNDLFTRYPSGGSNMEGAGAYIQYINSSLDSILSFHGGLRYSYFQTQMLYNNSDPIEWPSYFYDGIRSTNSALTWSAGINLQPNKDWTIRILASSAFRVPNIDDLGKVRVKSDNITVPNPDLGPERSINAEINIAKRINDKFQLNLSTFYTRLSDAIIRTNFALPDGSTTYLLNDLEFRVEGNINAEKAQIAGISTNIQYQITKQLHLNSSINYIKGNILNEENAALAHIPPLYGRNELKYKSGFWEFTLSNIYNGKKPIDEFGGSIDNPEYATTEGSLSWSIFNVYLSREWKQISIQMGVENIFDKHYSPFASGINGPGLNAIVALRTSF